MANNIEILINAKDGFSKTFSSFGSVIGVATKGLAIGATAAAGAAAGLVALTKATAETYDQVGKFSGRIGISTEALSAYHHVAEMSGVTNQQLNMGFQRMTRRISEAGQGTGVAVKALNELGISVDEINGRAPDKQFEMIAEAMEGVSSQSDRARLAMQFFDSEGVALLQTMSGGVQGLREMKEEAEKFGLVISQKAAVNAAAFNDALSRAHGALRGLKNFIAEETMPVLTGLANRFAYFVANNRAQIIDFVEKSIVVFGGLVEYTGYGVAAMIDAWRGLQMIWQLLVMGFAEFSAFINSGLLAMTEKIRETMEKLNFRGIFDSAIEKIKTFEEVQGNTIEGMREVAETAFSELNRVADQGLAMGKVHEFANTVKDVIAEIKAEGNLGSALGITEDDVMQTEENVERITQVQQDGIDALKAMRDDYVLSEQEKLEVWYETQQELYGEHKEAIALIDEIYDERRALLDERQFKREETERQKRLKANKKYNQQEAKRQDQIRKDEIKATTDQEEALYTLQKVFGIKGFDLAKIINIKKTIANTHDAAVGAYKALAPIPIIGPALGAAAAAAAIAYGMAQVASIRGQSIGGAAHGGLDYVPQEQTYLLDRGERVLSPRQNKDLTEALSGGGIGSSIYVDSFSLEIVLPNATNPEGMLDMTDEDWEDVVGEKVLPAFRTLANQGQTI